ncbi:dihydrofolate reductase family protein [Streptomyces sp. 6N223]|uniref:dihydrofolate reductase family protein n=1 Tax=Streptomyces sp. 6N223 TaxID=3457412 RepID=UPI003FD62443
MAGPDTGADAPGTQARPLVPLYEAPQLPRWSLPPALTELYGSDLGFAEPVIYSNFVASLDGVVALGPEHPSSGSAISGNEATDRFVMGLLRACADAVVIGAGTLRASPHHLWTPQHVYPAATADFAELRHRRRRAPDPELVVVTASGDLPTEHPALHADAVILTTAENARNLHARLPATCTVLAAGRGPRLPISNVIDAVRARGHGVVLTEGGPHLIGQLIRERLLDELFLTTAPVLAGRANTIRPGLIAGLELLPAHRRTADLVSARRRASYLFLRYQISHPLPPAQPANPT